MADENVADSGCLRAFQILVNKASGDSVLQVQGNKARKNCQIVLVLPIWTNGTPLSVAPLPFYDLLSCAVHWKATKEYLNQKGTKIRVFRVLFRAPFLPPFFPHVSPLFPLQALLTLPPLLPSSPPPLPCFFDSRKTPI